MRNLLFLGGLVAALTGWATGACAQPPTPLDMAGPFAFPGALVGPPSAASAGTGLADLWLGDEPYGNPAAAPARQVTLSPTFLHASRQDLRAHNREFDESSGFFDAAGGSLSWPVNGLDLSLYAWQPVLRREDNAYTRVAPEVPATLETSSSSREVRAGLALSVPVRSFRLGLAAEWTRRSDSYDFSETSGSPASGVRHAEFSGDALGFQAGARCAPHPRVVVGAAVRYLPSLDLEGSSSEQLILGAASSTVVARRGSAWEGGVSTRVSVTGDFRVLAAVGARSAETWDGFGLVAGRAASWALGLDYHDAEVPWTARFGLGQDQQSGVPEPRAGQVSLGLGWKLEEVVLDAAVLRRSIERPGKPTAYDDRLVASATVSF
jgi:hypothetical protein